MDYFNKQMVEICVIYVGLVGQSLCKVSTRCKVKDDLEPRKNFDDPNKEYVQFSAL